MTVDAVPSQAALVVRSAPRGVLVRGDGVRWRGGRYTVAGLDGATARLACPDGDRAPVAVLLPVLAAASDFAVLDRAGHPVARAGLQNFALLEGVPVKAAQDALAWERAVVEVDTGPPPSAPPGSAPRPEFDPSATTLIERYQTKAAELNAVLGWSVSWQTVQAKRLKYCKARTVMALVDGRSTEAKRELGLTDQRVVDQLLRLVDRQQRRVDAPCDARRLFKQLGRADATFTRFLHSHSDSMSFGVVAGRSSSPARAQARPARVSETRTLVAPPSGNTSTWSSETSIKARRWSAASVDPAPSSRAFCSRSLSCRAV
ncbi:hypothetical protein [Kitasatospora purpeofusca]|uniref:hypothetical protein n=1 Tax=Kitasatospora purpeofusca TaxID=67352 RepID=UPI003668C1E0